jgi:hypothetical protein
MGRDGVEAAEGNWVAAERAVKDLRDSKFKARQLELMGFNMGQDEGRTIKMTFEDYGQPYQEELAKNKELTERVAALEDQISAMRGQDRPRPPRPQLN